MLTIRATVLPFANNLSGRALRKHASLAARDKVLDVQNFVRDPREKLVTVPAQLNPCNRKKTLQSNPQCLKAPSVETVLTPE